jgi:vacuolar-type H+-ATPase subunit H
VDVQQKLDEITATVENARSMPMSASIVVNKAEMVAMLGELREALPTELAQAQQTVEQGDQVVEEARREAERIVAAAHAERAQLIAGTDLVMRAQAEADRLLAEARAESEEERREADDYVDSKLANFEVVLTKTLGAIGRGRAKLRVGGAPVEGEDGEEFAQDAFHSPSPEVDDYVDVKLAALETALGKTLEAVGRGRDKLLGKRPIDDLGAYLEAADQAATGTPPSPPSWPRPGCSRRRSTSRVRPGTACPPSRADRSRSPSTGRSRTSRSRTRTATRTRSSTSSRRSTSPATSSSRATTRTATRSSRRSPATTRTATSSPRSPATTRTSSSRTCRTSSRARGWRRPASLTRVSSTSASCASSADTSSSRAGAAAPEGASWVRVHPSGTLTSPAC